LCEIVVCVCVCVWWCVRCMICEYN
jgi:hypothetical protein